jgi:hypothetical protein
VQYCVFEVEKSLAMQLRILDSNPCGNVVEMKESVYALNDEEENYQNHCLQCVVWVVMICAWTLCDGNNNAGLRKRPRNFRTAMAR